MQKTPSKLLAIGLVVLIASVSTALAWVVYSGTLATVSLSVEAAEVVVVPATIDIGIVKSGYDFGPVEGLASVEVYNAKELLATINIANLDETEIAALTACYVDIWVDVDADGVLDAEDTYIGTIDALSPLPIFHIVSEGIHKFWVVCYGTASYPYADPAVDVPISFDVTITLETPPVIVEKIGPA